MSVASGSLAAGFNGNLYLATLSTRGNVAATSVTGLGLTWTLVKGQCAARGQTRVEVWQAQGAGTAGTVTASFGSAPANAVIAVSRYSSTSGIDGIGAIVSANTLGVDGACTGGTDSSSYSVNPTPTEAFSLVYGSIAIRNRTHTAGSFEITELQQGSGGDTVGLALTSSGATVNGTLGGATDWAVVAVEILP